MELKHNQQSFTSNYMEYWNTFLLSLTQSFIYKPYRQLKNNLQISSSILLFGSKYHYFDICALSGRTGSALVWHTRGRVFQPRLLQQVLRFVGHVYTVQYVELRKYCPRGWGGRDQSIGSTVSDTIVRSWSWSTST